ncbi:hypothetical protein N431DRAFT_179099 [Stipitochalara longipes BDJ]|nr:hypothetical protein N431DRAFT_179099 [Stipitochalara longipes BDJ]
MPNLTTTTSSAFLDRGGISIDNHARQPLDIILPNLREVTSIIISGGLGSVSLSALTSFTGNYYVFASSATPLVMNFDPLHKAGSIYVFGKIKSVNISSIQSIYLLSVSGDDPLDCGGLGKDYAKIKQLPQNSVSEFPSPGFLCSFTPRKSRLSLAAKIGIGFGVSALAIALLIWGGCLVNKKRDVKKEGSRLPSYHLASLDSAPKYSRPSIAEESTEYSEHSSPAPPAREHPSGGL